MSDLISRQNAIDSWDKLSKRGRTEFDQVLMTLPSAVCDDCIWHVCNYNKVDWDADVVSKGVFDQVKWERDTALKTLEDHGIGLGQKPKTGWIPVSERLPEDSGNYLITVADLRLGHIGENTVTMADFYAKAKKWNSIVDVYAWMPLPEPWKGGAE